MASRDSRQLTDPDEIIRWLQQPAWTAEILEAVLTSIEEQRDGRFNYYDMDTRNFIFTVFYDGGRGGRPGYDIYKASEAFIIDMIYAESYPENGKLRRK